MLIDFAQARSLVPIQAVLDLIGFTRTERTGLQLRGWCPFHARSGNAKSRSLAVNLGTGSWFCHRCKIGGDAFDLYGKAQGISTYEAATELCERVAGRVPYLGTGRGTVRGGQDHAED